MHIESGAISPTVAALALIVVGFCFTLLWYVYEEGFRSANLTNVQMVAVFVLFGDLFSIPFVPLDLHLMLVFPMFMIFSIFECIEGIAIAVICEALLGDGGLLNLGLNLGTNALLLPLLFVLIDRILRSFFRSTEGWEILRTALRIGFSLGYATVVIWVLYLVSSLWTGYPAPEFCQIIVPLLIGWVCVETGLNTIFTVGLFRTSRVFQTLRTEHLSWIQRLSN